MTELIDKSETILANDEGYRQFVYLDGNGIPTIGYGRNLRSKGMSKEEAIYLLKNDINDAIRELTHNFSWFPQLSINRQIVLIDMVINLGFSGFTAFKDFLAFLHYGEYQKAANDLRKTLVYQKLTNRYERLAKIIETDIYEPK